MKTIRHTILAVTTTLVAIVISGTAAVAAPRPLQPEITGSAGGGGGSTGSFFDSWPQATLSLVVAVVLALVVYELSWQRPRVSPAH